MTAPGSFLLINISHNTNLPTIFKVRKRKDIQKRQIINFQSLGSSIFDMVLRQINIKSGGHTPKTPPL